MSDNKKLVEIEHKINPANSISGPDYSELISKLIKIGTLDKDITVDDVNMIIVTDILMQD